MKPEMKRQFVGLIMRFKKIDFCFPSTAQMQSSELAVMLSASSYCALSDGCAGVSEIHQKLHISKAAVSQTLNALEKKGYIVRTIDPADRRKIMVALTPLGEQALSETQRAYDENLDELLTRYGEENARTLIRLISQLLEIFEAMDARQPPQ